MDESNSTADIVVLIFRAGRCVYLYLVDATSAFGKGEMTRSEGLVAHPSMRM